MSILEVFEGVAVSLGFCDLGSCSVVVRMQCQMAVSEVGKFSLLGLRLMSAGGYE
jgi:hypothetical protein